LLKIFVISLNANKTFLAHHLFNESGERHVEILQDEKLDKVMDKFQPLCSPNIWNLIASLNIVLVLQAPCITYFSLSQRVLMITFKTIVSLDKWLGKRCLCSKCRPMGQQVGLIW
jgi:hypothetical protein